MEIKQIKETCLYVADLRETRKFYQEKLGLELISFEEQEHVFLKAGSSVLLCFNPEHSKAKTNLPYHYADGPIHFAFQVEKSEYEAWKQKITDANIEIEHEESWRNNLLSFYFRDPDDNCVEIVMTGMWDW